MQKRFSASTAILVVLLLSVLYGVGRVVNPPGQGDHDHDHEDQPAAQQTPPPTAARQLAPPSKPGAPAQPIKRPDEAVPPDAMKQKMMAMQEQMKKAHAHETPAEAVRRQHKSDGMEPSLWQERDMGQVAAKPDAGK